MLALMAAVWSGCENAAGDSGGGSAASIDERLVGTWETSTGYPDYQSILILNGDGTLSGNWTGIDGPGVTKEWSVSDGTLMIMITAAGEGSQNISGPYELSEDGNTLTFTIEGMEEIFTRNP